MEQRKLIKLGNSSFAIALPKDWIDKSGLKKGDNIFVEQNRNGEITIMSKFTSINSPKIKEFDFSEKDDLKIQIELLSAYNQDYNIFKIKKTIEKPKIDYAKNLIKNLLSFEIIEETQDNITFKDVFNIEETSIENFIRRMDNIIRSMFEDIKNSIKNKKITQKQCEEIYKADKEVTKFHLFIERITMKALDNPALINMLKTDSIKLINNREISSNIEKIGDELKRITKSLRERIDAEELNKILAILDKLNNLYIMCLTSHYKRDKEKALEIIGAKEIILKECNKLSEGKSKNLGIIIEKLKHINSLIFLIIKKIVYTTY